MLKIKHLASSVMITLLGLLFLGTSTRAQTPPAPAPPAAQHFTISGNAVGFTSSTGTNVAEIMTAAMQLTTRVSAGYEHIAISALSARYEMGVVAYTLPLTSLVGQTLSSHFVFNSDNIQVTFSAGGGKLLQPTTNRIAETGGVHISYPLSDHVSMQLIGIDVVHGGPQVGFITTNTTTAISTGLNFSF